MLKSSNTVPKITYRKTRTIKSLIDPSKLKTIHNRPTPSRTFLTLNGMYQCKKQKCLTCKFVSSPKIFATKGNTYQFREFFNCSSDFVIYGIRCLCDLLYIGRTIQTLRKRFGEHRRSIKENLNLTIPRHFKEYPQGSTNGMRVWVIEQIPRTLSRVERFKRLCERETFWIYTLDALAPGGLKEDIEINPVL